MSTKTLTRSANVHTRLDPELKLQALKVLDGLGISLTNFIQLSLQQVVQDRAVRFELSLLANDKAKDYTEVQDLTHLKKLINFK
jgi:addiction module RelB/DinJ family antitoxin